MGTLITVADETLNFEKLDYAHLLIKTCTDMNIAVKQSMKTNGVLT